METMTGVKAQRIAAPGKLVTPGKLQAKVEWFLNVLVSIVLVVEVFVMFGNLVSRTLFKVSLVWSAELSQLGLIAIVFLGGAVAYPKGEHLAIKTLVSVLPERIRVDLDALVNWIVLGLSVLIGIAAVRMMMAHMNETSVSLGIRAGWFALPTVLGMVFLTYFVLQHLLLLPWRDTVIIGACTAAVASTAVLTLPVWIPFVSNSVMVSISFVSFVLFLLIGMPIVFVLQFVAVIFLFINHSVPITMIPLQMHHGVSSFVILAIPFFIMVGYIMTEGGLSRRLVEGVLAVVGGRVRGGLYHVIVVVMYIVSGISGSKVADVSAVGTSMNKMLQAHGYDRGESAAVFGAAAIMGDTVPPSTAMLVLGSITSVSIGTLFMAGLLPAFVMGVCIIILILIRARMLGLKKEKAAGFGEVCRKLLSGMPAFLAPVILIGGIVVGVATPTEVSSVAVFYALVLSAIFYREISWSNLWRILVDTSAKGGMILMIVASAGVFSWSMIMQQVPQRIASFMGSLGGSPSVFMLISIIVLSIGGAVLEGLPGIIILGPLMMPLAPQFGIHPIQYAIVMVLCNGIGCFMPPIGIGSFVCCSICETTLEDLTRKMLPYWLCVVSGLILISCAPWFSLVVPRMLHLIK
jgi:tripartite ATP-independent transporter DctM subunit